jgi:glycosyltransferase involved in cell wall biosynthesis
MSLSAVAEEEGGPVGTLTKTRIVFLIPSLGGGGAEYQLSRLAKGMDPSRYNVTVACLSMKGVYVEELRDAGVELLDLGLVPPRTLSAGNVRRLVRFANWLRNERVDIFHSWLGAANRVGVMVSSLGRPRVTLQSYRGLGYGDPKVYALAARLGQFFVDGILVNSRAIRDSLVHEGIAPRRIEVIYNGIELERFSDRSHRGVTRRALGFSDDELVVGTVASMREVKGYQVLLEAIPEVLSQLPKAVFCWAGDGKDRQSLCRRVDQLGVSDRVRMIGFRRDTDSLYPAFDLLVVPSLSEGFPNVIVESFAAGTPVVASSVGGIPEIVEDGVNGRLVAARDVRGLSQTIVATLADDQLTAEMGRAAQSTGARYSIESMVEKMCQYYQAALK